MKTNLMSTPVTGLVPHALRDRFVAPNTAAQGTAVPSAGCPAAATAPVAVLGGDVLDLPGLPLRAAPV